MTPQFFIRTAMAPALSMIGLDTPEARAMLLAIAFQESRLIHRRQIKGPARGYFQFEQGGGVAGVLKHRETKARIRQVLETLDYGSAPGSRECWNAIEHNDILACCFARFLLWTLPDKLPKRDQSEVGWKQYIKAWRPGRPRHETWAKYWEQAWEEVRLTPTEGVSQ